MIERIPRLIGAAFGQWMESEHDYKGWMRVYPQPSGEHMKLSIGFYNVRQEYIGRVTVVEDAPGANLRIDIELPPHREGDN